MVAQEVDEQGLARLIGRLFFGLFVNCNEIL